MNPLALLFIWMGSLALAWAFGVATILYPPNDRRQRQLGALLMSGSSSIAPFITLLLFLHVFVIGGSSNVAQLAGQTGYRLWSLWFGTWPICLIANLGATVVCIAAAFFRPSPRNDFVSFASRVCAAIAASTAVYALFKFAPDA